MFHRQVKIKSPLVSHFTAKDLHVHGLFGVENSAVQ